MESSDSIKIRYWMLLCLACLALAIWIFSIGYGINTDEQAQALGWIRVLEPVIAFASVVVFALWIRLVFVDDKTWDRFCKSWDRFCKYTAIFLLTLSATYLYIQITTIGNFPTSDPEDVSPGVCYEYLTHGNISDVFWVLEGENISMKGIYINQTNHFVTMRYRDNQTVFYIKRLREESFTPCSNTDTTCQILLDNCNGIKDSDEQKQACRRQFNKCVSDGYAPFSTPTASPTRAADCISQQEITNLRSDYVTAFLNMHPMQFQISIANSLTAEGYSRGDFDFCGVWRVEPDSGDMHIMCMDKCKSIATDIDCNFNRFNEGVYGCSVRWGDAETKRLEFDENGLPK